MHVGCFRVLLPMLLAAFVMSERAAGHFDIFLARPADGTKTVIGGADVPDLEFDSVTRIFEVELGAIGGEFVAVEPGVHHPNLNNPVNDYPASAAGLQPGDVLRLREREFSVGGVVSGLFYWSGAGPVSFAPAAAGFGIDEGDPLDGVAGPGGFFDEHPFFVVDSTAQPGIYLASIVGIVDGFDPSAPAYLVMGTHGLEDLHELIELAADYVYATLVIPEPASLGLVAIACFALATMRFRQRRRAEL